MKNVLFATTALIAAAGVASADVTVGGSAYMGVTHDGTDTTVVHRMRLTFSGSVETDSGIMFSASSRMTETNGAAAPAGMDRTKVSLSSGGLSLAVGATNGAMRSLARTLSYGEFTGGDLGTMGFDTAIGALADGNAPGNVYLSYAMGDLVVGIGSDIDGNEQDIAVRYTVNSFTIGAGMNNNDDWALHGSLDLGNASAAIGYNSNETALLTFGYDISDATALNLAVQDAAAGTSYALHISQDLGGATLTGSVGQTAASATVAALGVSFGF